MSVYRKLDLITVAIDPYGYGRALMPFQIPVRKNMKHRFFRPPCLKIICLVLRETAIIQNAELGTCGREHHRIRLSSIVKARPVEQPAEPRSLIIEFPSPFYAVVKAVRPVFLPVMRNHASVVMVIIIYSPGSASACLFRA